MARTMLIKNIISIDQSFSADKRRRINASLTLVKHRRWSFNVKPTLIQLFVSAGFNMFSRGSYFRVFFIIIITLRCQI